MSQDTHTTKDYKKFSFLIDNRDTSRQHINRLKDAIKHDPRILEIQPLIVNEKFQIIDGQHRFTAASELGLPITYTVASGLDINAARKMNILQRKWTFDDYARSYAKVGNIHYKAFLEFQIEYPLIKNQTLVVYMLGYQKHGVLINFREGNFIVERQEEDIKEDLDRASEVAESIEVPFSHSLAMAFLNCLRNEDFEFDRFMTKLKQKPGLITRGGTRKEYLRQIEDIYNFQNKNVTRLS